MVFEGKTAIVTGGTGHLGKVIVMRLLREGATVWIAARGDLKGEVFDAETREAARFVKTDVTDEESVERLFSEVGVNGGKAEILVNCVGAFARTGPFAGTSSADWEGMLSVNLRSVFLCCRAFLRQTNLAGFGRIVNFTAQTVYRPSRERAPYAVAKGGVATLTEALGEELRGSGITVNAIAPSIIRTEDNLRSMPGADASGWVDPAEVASEVVNLCTPAAAAINGAIIPMFGGVKA